MNERQTEVENPAPPSIPSRLVILVLSLPSVILWGLMALYATFILVHLLDGGPVSGGGGRAFYACFMCLVTLVGAFGAIWGTRKVLRGSASLLWIAVIFVGGVLDLAAFGLLGD